ncbi:hypothetical protein RP20_CCG009306 [Aedes albopictus]|nr:hypothetical protein RP20_CCG009306 [Aedes albopictus]
MRCAVCNYYTWSYFIAFAEIFVSFEVASALLQCSRELNRVIACYDVEPVVVMLVLYNFLSLTLIIGVFKRVVCRGGKPPAMSAAEKQGWKDPVVLHRANVVRKLTACCLPWRDSPGNVC